MIDDPLRIEGVRILQLDPHRDDRGVLVELLRTSEFDGFPPVQWNFMYSDANVLRGVHVHPRHTDLIFVLSGAMRLGLHDMRSRSTTRGITQLVTLTPTTAGVMVPPGVAHGFYFPQPTALVYCTSHEWSMDDELTCRWDDPDLGIEWGCTDPVLSARDAAGTSLAAATRALQATGR